MEIPATYTVKNNQKQPDSMIIADSISTLGKRMTTFLLPRFPRCLLAELNTHRMLSRNAQSSRAIPVERRISNILEDTYIPLFTKNQKGMVGSEIEQESARLAVDMWLHARDQMIASARWLSGSGVHKEMANRLLEPFARIPVLVSGTEWDNFFLLRTGEDTAPDFRAVALSMLQQYELNQPMMVQDNDWHWVFRTNEIEQYPLEEQLLICAARCARISYTLFDGSTNPDADLALAQRLIKSGHWSPFEHIATPCQEGETANLRGWQSLRTRLGG